MNKKAKLTMLSLSALTAAGIVAGTVVSCGCSTTTTEPTANFNQHVAISQPEGANINRVPTGLGNGITRPELVNLAGIPVEEIRKMATIDGTGVATGNQNPGEVGTNVHARYVVPGTENQQQGIIATPTFSQFQRFIGGSIGGVEITTQAQFDALEEIITWDLWSLGQFLTTNENPVATPVNSFGQLNGPSAWVILPNIKESATPEDILALQSANLPEGETDPTTVSVFGAGNNLGGSRVWTQNVFQGDPLAAEMTLTTARALANNNGASLSTSGYSVTTIFDVFTNVMFNGNSFTEDNFNAVGPMNPMNTNLTDMTASYAATIQLLAADGTTWTDITGNSQIVANSMIRITFTPIEGNTPGNTAVISGTITVNADPSTGGR